MGLKAEVAELEAGIQWDPPRVDPHWQATLDSIAPRSDQRSWLKLVWIPGEVWERVERWAIYQMMPKSVMINSPMGATIIEWLEGPNPRDLLVEERGRMVSKAPPISQLQWQLYREHQAYGQRLWVIQGEKGGHKATFNKVERTLAVAANRPAEPPSIGDLPYAEPNRLTFEKLRLCMAMRDEARVFDEQSRETGLADDSRAALEFARERLLAWIDDQLDEDVAELAFHVAPHLDHAPRGKGTQAGEERWREDFIQGRD